MESTFEVASMSLPGHTQYGNHLPFSRHPNGPFASARRNRADCGYTATRHRNLDKTVVD